MSEPPERRITKIKIPDPKDYSGDGSERTLEAFTAWERSVKDHWRMEKDFHNQDPPEASKILFLQFCLKGTAKNFYNAKRDTYDGKTLNDLLKDLKNHLIPTTHEQGIYEKWNRINQSHGGSVKPINDIGIEILKTSQQLGTDANDAPKITEYMKIQKLMDSMHPELRLAVEPHIDRSQKELTFQDVLDKATKADHALHQAKKYKRHENRGHASSAALQPARSWPPNKRPGGKPFKPRPGYQGKLPFRQTSPAERDTLRKQNLCFYCKKAGHIARNCNTRKNSGNNHRSSANTSVDPPSESTMTIAQFASI